MRLLAEANAAPSIAPFPVAPRHIAGRRR